MSHRQVLTAGVDLWFNTYMTALAIIRQSINPCPAVEHGDQCSKKAGHDGPHVEIWLDPKQNRRTGRVWE